MYDLEDYSTLSPDGHPNNCHDGIMGNISSGGMFFESDTPCWGNGPVYINLLGNSKGLLESNDTGRLSGTVVWCRESSMKGHSQFRIGVKFDSQQPIEKRFAHSIGAAWLS